MMRYIKVNNRWIDTLSEQRDFHVIYMVIDNKVHAIIDNGDETITGLLQDESDEEHVEPTSTLEIFL